MAKKVKTTIKLTIAGGQAAPGQKLGPVLGAAGVPMGNFVKDFNDQTKEMMGLSVPVVLTVYEDRTYSMAFKKPTVTSLIKKELNIKKGSGKPNKSKVGKITQAQIQKIAEIKLPDLNTRNLDSAVKTVTATAQNMGLNIV
jgi:large subunit ribosomal protein L11